MAKATQEENLVVATPQQAHKFHYLGEDTLLQTWDMGLTLLLSMDLNQDSLIVELVDLGLLEDMEELAELEAMVMLGIMAEMGRMEELER